MHTAAAFRCLACQPDQPCLIVDLTDESLIFKSGASSAQFCLGHFS